MKRSMKVALGFTLLSLGACHPRLPIPFTADRLARVNSGYALMHYLRQSDAGLSVCDPQSQGPRVDLRKPSDMKELAAGLHTVDAGRWRECTQKLITALPLPLSSQLMTDLSGVYRRLLIDKQIEQDGAVQARLAALHTLYLDRPRDVAVPAPKMDSRMADLRNALAKQRLSPTAVRYGRDLLMAVSLEAGTWNGGPVTMATLDEALAQKDEELLRRMGSRLPDAALRGEAVRRLVRLRIARSPYDEVRAAAQAVEDRVVQQGNNPLSLAEHKPLRAWLDGEKLPRRQVLMRQKVWKQRVTLLGNAPDRATTSVLPELNLRGILSIEMEGVSRPVTLCAPPQEHDPDPCLPATLLEIQNPMVYRDTSGVFRFVEHVSAQDALRIVGNGRRFPMPLTVPGALITGFDWGLRFERPEPLIFHGPGPGAPGPNLGVGVDTRDEARLVFSVSSGQTYFAVVEREEVPSYAIGTAGGRGFTGETGYRGQDGAPGAPGRPAHCPSREGGRGGDGYPGGPGGDGGPGGPGGPGGSVDVQIGCGGRPCQDVLSLVQPVFFSRGGDGGFGGSGGSGGNGGPGGPGGPGATCTRRERVRETEKGKTKWREVTRTYSLSSGSSGSWGPSGPRGLDGPPGPPGPPGPVNITME